MQVFFLSCIVIIKFVCCICSFGTSKYNRLWINHPHGLSVYKGGGIKKKGRVEPDVKK